MLEHQRADGEQMRGTDPVPLRTSCAWWARAYSSASLKREVTIVGGAGWVVVTFAPWSLGVCAGSWASQAAASVSS
jgi:hypothetical protein